MTVPRLSIVVPTRHEAPNIRPLVDRLHTAFRDVDAALDVLFVDDSDDDTAAVIRAVMAHHDDVALLARPPGQRHGGLGGAVQAGFGRVTGDTIVVMDADLQHPPEIIPRLAAPVLAGRVQIAVGTRYQDGGTPDGLDGLWRHAVSRAGRLLVHGVVRRSRPLSDPLSGLFAFDRQVLDGVELRSDGFKILLEVVARGRWERCTNQPFEFAPRHAGRSKAGLREGARFSRHLARLARTAAAPEPLVDLRQAAAVRVPADDRGPATGLRDEVPASARAGGL